MKKSRFASTTIACAFLLLGACADSTEVPGHDTGATKLSERAQSLSGAYVSDGGDLGALHLKDDGSFSALARPCATCDEEQLDGTFVVGRHAITLQSSASSPPRPAHGRYDVVRLDGGAVSLERDGARSTLQPLTDAVRLARAKSAILDYVEHELVFSNEWRRGFGERTWIDVAGHVQADVAAFEYGEYYERVARRDDVIFLGSVYGLYTEVAVDHLGRITRVYLEID
jgi:hypothetical protein